MRGHVDNEILHPVRALGAGNREAQEGRQLGGTPGGAGESPASTRFISHNDVLCSFRA